MLSRPSASGTVSAESAPVTGAKASPSGVVITLRGLLLPPLSPPMLGNSDEPSPIVFVVLADMSVQTSYTSMEVPKSAERPPPTVIVNVWNAFVANPPKTYNGCTEPGARLSTPRGSTLPS